MTAAPDGSLRRDSREPAGPGSVAVTRSPASVRPLPRFASIMAKATAAGEGDAETLTFYRQDFMQIIRAFIAAAPFDREFYAAHAPGFEELEATGRISSLRAHWLSAGYFEGRPVYGWEPLPLDIAREILSAPDAYFDNIKNASLAECAEAYEEAEAGYLAAILVWEFSLGAHIALARLYFKTRQLVACEAIAQKALTIEPNCKEAVNLLSDVFAAFNQAERSIGFIDVTGQGLNTDDLLRVYNSGRVSLARRLMKNGRGDWINLRLRTQAIEIGWKEVRSKVKTSIAGRKSRTLTGADMIEIGHYLAQIGWYSLPLRICSTAFRLDGDGTRFDNLPPQSQMLALDILRLCEGSAAALAAMKSYCSPQYTTESPLLKYRIKLAYDANDLKDVIDTGLRYEIIQQDIASLEYIVISLIRKGQSEQAIDILRKNWPALRHVSWAHGASLFARREQNFCRGLSFGQIASRSNMSMIPKTIMQFWDNPQPPDDVATAITTWSDVNPEFSHILFSNDTAKVFLESHYGSEFVALFDYCHHPAMKSDFFRLAYLSEFGGIYVDADEISNDPLINLLAAHPERDLFLCLAPDAFFTSNGFIACTPRHPIILKTFQNAASDLKSAMDRNIKPDIWRTTGPGQLTLTVAEAMLDAGSDSPIHSTGFLYWHTRGRFSQMREFEYKKTISGNWRAMPLG